MLPASINLRWVQPVSEQFHARYGALRRSYRYLILNRPTRSALAAGRALVVYAALETSLMQAAANCLVGEHDFSAFRAAECQARSPVRTVHTLSVVRHGDWVSVEVTANAFLQHMVRNIVGTLLAVGRGEAGPERAREQLESRRRSTGEATAAAHGLYLWRVDYPPQFGLPDDSAMIDFYPRHRGSIALTWFEKIVPSRIKTERRSRSVPEGLWIKCPACDAVLYRAELERNLNVCPKCSHHMRIGARERLQSFLDPGRAVEIGARCSPKIR